MKYSRTPQLRTASANAREVRRRAHRWAAVVKRGGAATTHVLVLSNEGQLFRREEPLSWGRNVSCSSK